MHKVKTLFRGIGDRLAGRCREHRDAEIAELVHEIGIEIGIEPDEEAWVKDLFREAEALFAQNPQDDGGRLPIGLEIEIHEHALDMYRRDPDSARGPLVAPTEKLIAALRARSNIKDKNARRMNLREIEELEAQIVEAARAAGE